MASEKDKVFFNREMSGIWWNFKSKTKQVGPEMKNGLHSLKTTRHISVVSQNWKIKLNMNFASRSYFYKVFIRGLLLDLLFDVGMPSSPTHPHNALKGIRVPSVLAALRSNVNNCQLSQGSSAESDD